VREARPLPLYEAEAARLLEALGVDPREAVRRLESVAGRLREETLRSVEAAVAAALCGPGYVAVEALPSGLACVDEHGARGRVLRGEEAEKAYMALRRYLLAALAEWLEELASRIRIPLEARP